MHNPTYNIRKVSPSTTKVGVLCYLYTQYASKEHITSPFVIELSFHQTRKNRRFFPILLLTTLSSLRLLLKMNVIYSFPLHLTSPAEHQFYSARILTLFQGFSLRILTSFEVWIPLRRCSMLTPGLENQCPLLHTSEANIKKNNLNQNTVKRSQQRSYQPVITAAFRLLECTVIFRELL